MKELRDLKRNLLGEKMVDIEPWIPAISALMGALIGGSFSFFGTWLSFKKQLEHELLLRKIDKLQKTDNMLFAPFLRHAYRLDAKRETVDIDGVLDALREGRGYFIYCSSELKKRFLRLYSNLERKCALDGTWTVDDVNQLLSPIKQIEGMIHSTVVEMEL